MRAVTPNSGSTAQVRTCQTCLPAMTTPFDDSISGFGYAVRLPANSVLEHSIGHLLNRRAAVHRMRSRAKPPSTIGRPIGIAREFELILGKPWRSTSDQQLGRTLPNEGVGFVGHRLFRGTHPSKGVSAQRGQLEASLRRRDRASPMPPSRPSPLSPTLTEPIDAP
jgi:hypothetical protein